MVCASEHYSVPVVVGGAMNLISLLFLDTKQSQPGEWRERKRCDRCGWHTTFWGYDTVGEYNSNRTCCPNCGKCYARDSWPIRIMRPLDKYNNSGEWELLDGDKELGRCAYCGNSTDDKECEHCGAMQ